MTIDDDDIREYDDPEFGLELDKLQVPDAASIQALKKPGKTPTYEKPEETEFEIEVEAESQKGSRFKVIIAAAAILVAAALFFLLNHKAIKPLLISGSQANSKKSFEYHTLDPIITNLGENGHIEISLRLRYRTDSKEQNSAIEPLVRDSILMFLNSPDIQRKVNESNLVKLTPYIDNRLTNFLKTDYGNEVILTNLKVY